MRILRSRPTATVIAVLAGLAGTAVAASGAAGSHPAPHTATVESGAPGPVDGAPRRVLRVRGHDQQTPPGERRGKGNPHRSTSTSTSTSTTVSTTTATATSSTSTVAPTSTAAPSTSTSTTTTSSTSSSSTSSSTVPPDRPGRPSTADVIDPDAPSTLFFSDNDNCTSIDRGKAHPDWIEGQSSPSTNEDGAPTYGFAYNTGSEYAGDIAWGFRPLANALSGDCVLAMTLNDAYSSTQAVRIFRRYDRHGSPLPARGYYSAWFLFPHELSYDARSNDGGSTRYGFWNVFQIKNKVNGTSLANLSVNAGKVTGEDFMSFHIWRKSDCGAIENCSAAGSVGQTDPVPIPVGQWVHLEMYLQASAGGDGRIMMWQDGVPIIDFTGPTERVGTERRAWSVNNYGVLHRPSSHTLFVDDALISTASVHPRLFDGGSTD